MRSFKHAELRQPGVAAGKGRSTAAGAALVVAMMAGGTSSRRVRASAELAVSVIEGQSS
jgi:hypothetical protein